MKRIEAVIRPDELPGVTDALVAVGVDDFAVSNVYGFGRQQGQKVYYRGLEYTADFVSRTRLDVFVSDALAGAAIAAILASARTGAAGDGMIVVREYADAIPVCVYDGAGADDANEPTDEQGDPSNEQDDDVREESARSHRRLGAAAIATGLIKLLGLAGARWHDLFR